MEQSYYGPSSLVAISSTLPVLAIAVVCLRFYARHTQKAPLKVDDWIMLPTLALVIGMSVVVIYGVKKHGYGQPAPLNPQMPSGVGSTITAFSLLQTGAFGCIKLGALLFFRRLFVVKHCRSWFDIVTFTMIVIIVLWIIAFTVGNATQCGTHLSASWSGPTQFFQYCSGALSVMFGFAITDFLTDIIIIIIPLSKVWSLHMSFPRKIGVTIVFMSALVGLAASITRMVNVIYSYEHVRIVTVTADPRLEDSQLVFWGILEAGLATIAVNLPSVWGLHHKCSPDRIFRSIRSVTVTSLRSKSSNDRPAASSGSTGNYLTSFDAPFIFEGGQQGAKIDTNASRDIEAQVPNLSAEKVWVQKSFLQTRSKS